jgi:hypothetical protein
MSSFEANVEIDPATNPIVVDFRILEERVKELSQELPGVTFGYIGNLERWGDDRSWAVFLPHPARVGGFNDQISIGTTEKLPAAVNKWAAIAESARKRYHNGSRRA